MIAYSTCSQLGYMFAAAGVASYDAAMFHLFTHAFFKALLFLSAGAVIHSMHHEQDMRKMGGLWKAIPFTWAMMLIGNLALTGVGIPYLGVGLAGFYSKDAIINADLWRPYRHRHLCLHPAAGLGGHDQLLFLAPVPDDLPWPLSRAGSSASGASATPMP